MINIADRISVIHVRDDNPFISRRTAISSLYKPQPRATNNTIPHRQWMGYIDAGMLHALNWKTLKMIRTFKGKRHDYERLHVLHCSSCWCYADNRC